MIFALHNAKTYDGVVDPAKRLVIPAVRAGSDECRDVYDTQPRELYIQMGSVWVVFGVAHDKLLWPFKSMLWIEILASENLPHSNLHGTADLLHQ